MTSRPTINALLKDLETRVATAGESVFIIERHLFGASSDAEHRLETEEILAGSLGVIFRRCAMALEWLGLHQTRVDLIKSETGFQKHGLANVVAVHERDLAYCPALEYVSGCIQTIRLFSSEHAFAEPFGLDKLESILRNTAVLVRRRCPAPRKEKDVHDVMRDYLSAFFADYVPSPRLPGFIGNFVPDSGIKSLRAAIEFKFAADEAEVRTALSGIFEDSAGYKGSEDWVRFFSVLYMTEPFESAERIEKELLRGELFSWKAIVVNGGGKRLKAVAPVPRPKMPRRGKRL